MNVYDIINQSKPSLSFEVFPPKSSDTFESVKKAALDIAKLEPSFMSVTYGAGGSTAGYTAEIASALLEGGVTPLAHLSCVSATKDKIRQQLSDFKARGIKNILALRGDLPQGVSSDDLEYHYASDLAKEIRDFGGFCIGGACYPECHPESANGNADIDALRIKVENGCQFLTTQMFFDNNILYNFIYRLYRAHVEVPIVAGIMPVTNAAQIKRILSISQSALPQKFVRIVDRYQDNPEAMKQAGIAFATEQIIDLYANGINAVHVYSMNKPEVAEAIKNNISHIIE
ncbi:MAG: methylenetetrahydrofolate reductase [NAD(P)H] [Clostridiales bacterium]|nr:methylenetetrahydrofolate reductase [NAD(P)H] [Clostridiales bacterium]